MGSLLGSILANAFMCYFESSLIGHFHLSEQHKNIKFTSELKKKWFFLSSKKF